MQNVVSFKPHNIFKGGTFILFIWQITNWSLEKLRNFLPKVYRKCQEHVCFCCCSCCVDSVVSDSVRPHRRQPTRLPRPWGFPGKNTGVGCHFLLQCMKVKSESEVTQSCPTLCYPMDCSLPGSSVHGIFQQEYWSGVPLPSLKHVWMASKSIS